MGSNYNLLGGPLGHSAREYLNYEERNIHVWGSTVTQTGFNLIGGLYSNGDVTFGDVCDMLQRLLMAPPIYPPDTQIKFALMALKSCPVPIDDLTGRPRTDFSNLEAFALTKRYDREVEWIRDCMGRDPRIGGALARPSDSSLIPVQQNGSPSHFVCLIKICYSTQGKIYEKVLEVAPLLIPSPIVNRKGPYRSTAAGTGNKTATRSDTTRKAVRERDSICRVTGAPVLPRMRGTNYTGFEVAHIFPLAWALQDHAPKFPSPIQPYLTIPKLADKPPNAFLLRADIHSQFDEYQFSAKPIYLPGAHNQTTLVWWLMRFERNGASSLPHRDQPDPNRLRRLYGPVTFNVQDFDFALMNHHFTVALNWHVLGFGRERE
ncbi:hypothetical protein E1B28_000175 [Marasmius oreades]|uniref:HNH nuclease domain-containing protein n=1 Tax=Marasmius oreades TaxID=181124 RepID=A0A9P7V0W7_9AGAR|nr:uncharacterized protein E1B28_000175 [Marasmius oreades]KAG7098207.1 hypothetical protein E1B28_000175 [Marasmius oreades]